uniref:PIR Superfamily Protein n=1 Tax=Schistosoma mansoni TaxID=6183 RepID=A0A5K4FB60_SCHMA
MVDVPYWVKKSISDEVYETKKFIKKTSAIKWKSINQYVKCIEKYWQFKNYLDIMKESESVINTIEDTYRITVPLASKLKECFNTQKLFYEKKIRYYTPNKCMQYRPLKHKDIDVLHNRIFHKHQEILLLNIDLFKHQFLIDIMKEMNSPSGNIDCSLENLDNPSFAVAGILEYSKFM